MIAIGCDHGGFELKEAIVNYLKEKNINCHFVENKKNPECGNLQTLMIMPILFGILKGLKNNAYFLQPRQTV